MKWKKSASVLHSLGKVRRRGRCKDYSLSRSPGSLSQLLTPRHNLSLGVQGRVTILPKLGHTEVLLVALGREAEQGRGRRDCAEFKAK